MRAFHRKIPLKYLKISIGIAILLSIFGWSLYDRFTDAPYQKIIFSNTLHTNERVVVRKMFAEEISESKRAGGFDNIEIAIAKYDLNHDGIQDIFVMISGSSFCGSQGCRTMIYTVDKHTRWHEAYSFNTYPAWGVSSQKHNGYFDLVRVGPVDGHPVSDCFLLNYEWKNGFYEGVGYRKLTKKDLEVLVDDDIR